MLNELNGAKWSQDNDKWYRFDADDRLSIYEELFERYKSVSFKKLRIGSNAARLLPHRYMDKVKESLSLNSVSSFLQRALGTDECPGSDQVDDEESSYGILFEDK